MTSRETQIDVATPEEMRWLAMLPKVPLAGSKDFRFRFGAVAGKFYRVQVARAMPLKALGGEPACLMNEFEADFFPTPG